MVILKMFSDFDDEQLAYEIRRVSLYLHDLRFESDRRHWDEQEKSESERFSR